MPRTLRAAIPALLVTVALPALPPAPAAAQDVELLGRMHGTRPPDAYFELLETRPDAFRFGRAWRGRTGLGPPVRDPNLPAGVQGQLRMMNFVERGEPVEGRFAFPVALTLFADSDYGGTYDGPHTPGDVQREFFDGPSSRFRTVSEYYEEVSGGRVELTGETTGWLRSELDRSEVTGGVSGLGSGAKVGEFVREAAERLDEAGFDWGRYDNDGPDGVPNSGDDDGFVDVFTVMHPTPGAECDQDPDRIWSHKWRLGSSTGQTYTTSTPSANGDSIRIDDYVVAPVQACGESGINRIGVFVHELGHAFGLPDLYGTGAQGHNGVGSWDLMGTGAWGCGGSGSSAARPCRPGAWTSSVLGWTDVQTIEAGAEPRSVDLAPVTEGGGVLRVESNDGSGEFFLLEHRARDGSFDETLHGEGLLVWHVDPTVLDERWPANRVNADPAHPGVWLRQADGTNELMEGASRGDAGDPFPGSTGRRAFHADTEPSSFTHAGEASGLTVTGLERSGGAVRFDLSNFYHTIALRTEEASGDTSYFSVDGAPAPSDAHEFESAPFERHVVEAAGGAVVSPGVREAFVRWEDGTADPVRDFQTRSDSVLVATYGGERELHFDVELVAESDTVTPGTVTMDPGTHDGWVPDGAVVSVSVEARNGFSFDRWGGDFDGRDPSFAIQAVDPLQASAHFDVTYAARPVETPLALTAATSAEIDLETVNGTEPVVWSFAGGRLPSGLELEPGGRIHGVPLEDGGFSVALRARDDIGLEAVVELELVVAPPAVGLSTLTAPFLLNGPGPTDLEVAYLDRSGNENGRYDVGDLRAFVRAHPDTPDEDPAAAPAVDVELAPVLLEAPAGTESEGRDGQRRETGSEDSGGGER